MTKMVNKLIVTLSSLTALALIQSSCLATPDLNNTAQTEAGASKNVPAISTDNSSPNSTTRPKVGLALGGGGTRGAAHVGVIKVFEREGIPIDYIAGTSMGSIVGGIYSAGVPISTLERDFADTSLMHAFMTVPLSVRLIVSPIILATRLVHHPYDGLYKGNKFRKYLDRLTPAPHCQIESLKIPFCAVALNIADGKIYSLSKGDLGYAMQASSAVPGLRKPVEIDNKLYVDGGVMANVPVQQVREMGADIVIAVDVDERVHEAPLKTFRKIGSVSKRTLLLQLANGDAPLIAQADILIHPDVDGIGLVSTKPEDAKRAMAEGEKAAEAALPAIREKLAKAGVLSLKPVQ